ncbi:MAG: hypothetical protein H7A36_05210 [Chlamydiales bacterium]|nr:hypothetical protein [Chlamydiales bacterium]
MKVGEIQIRDYHVFGAAAAVVSAGLITMLVCGILGSKNVIPLSNLGQRMLVAIPVATLAVLLFIAGRSSCE